MPGERRILKRFVVLVAGLMICLMGAAIGGPTSAQGAASGANEFAPLYRLFRTDSEPADYVVALDTSGSITASGLWPLLQDSLVGFVQSLNVGDYLSVITFDTHVGYLVLPQPISEDRSGIIQVIRQRGSPRGQHTDIGAALERAVAELRRPGAHRTQFFFILTDGKHEPPPGSRYPGKTGPPWDALRRTAVNTLSDRMLQVTALGIGQDTDVSLVRSVFPDALTIVVDRAALRAFFGRRREELRREKLRLQMGSELSAGIVAVDAPASTVLTGHPGEWMTLPLAFSNRCPHLPVAVRYRLIGQHVVTVDESWHDLRIPAGQEGRGDVRLRFPGERRWLQWPPRRENIPGRLALEFHAAPEAADLIRKLDLEPETHRRISLERPALVLRVPFPWAHLVLALVLLTALCTFTWKLAVWLRPAQLWGTLVISGPEGRRTRPLRGRSVTVGSRRDRVDIVLAGENVPEESFRLYAQKPPRSVWLQRLEGEIKIKMRRDRDGSEVSGRPVRIEPGTSISLGEYTLTWT
jgi:hypothetical protein